MIILQLKCKPQVFYYLRKMYGEKMRLGEYDIASTLILNTAICNRVLERDNDRVKKYPCFYPICFTNNQYYKYSLKTFTPTSIRTINKYIDALFELAFILFVTNKKHIENKRIKDSIEEFMMLYDIDEELYSYDALKKDYERYQSGKKKNIEKLLRKNTLSFVA